MRGPSIILLFTNALIPVLLIGSSACRPREVIDPVQNFTDGVFNGLMDIMKGTGDFIQNITSDANQDIGKTVDRVLNVTTNATQTIVSDVISTAPRIINGSAHVIRGIAKTSQDTRPIIQNGFEEYNRHMDLASKFVSAYTEVTIDNFRKFMDFFGSRFRCNTECERLEKGSEERKTCEDKYCIEFKPPKTYNLSPEDYVNTEENESDSDEV